MNEAIRRASAYHQAGADAILIHSAKASADEVLGFKQEWGDRCPVVIVPTKYYATPTDVFRENEFSLIIWANHLLRSAVTAMQDTARLIFEEQNLHSVEDGIASVGEIFRLQGARELQLAEERYLPVRAEKTQGIVLAASRGSDLGELTAEIPKTMIMVRDKSLLAHIVDTFNASGVKQLTAVRGYKKEAIDLTNVDYVDNDQYAETGEIFSLQLALDADKDSQNDLVVSYGDVLFKKYILDALLESAGDFVIAVDAGWRESANKNRAADYVSCSVPNSRDAFYQEVSLLSMAEVIAEDNVHGEWMGILKVSAEAKSRFHNLVSEIVGQPDGSGKRAKMPLLFNELIKRGETIRVIYTTGHWLDVDTVDDVVTSSRFG